MPWVVKKPPSHRCDPPIEEARTERLGQGSLWTCDECGSWWLLADDEGRHFIRTVEPQRKP